MYLNRGTPQDRPRWLVDWLAGPNMVVCLISSTKGPGACQEARLKREEAERKGKIVIFVRGPKGRRPPPIPWPSSTK